MAEREQRVRRRWQENGVDWVEYDDGMICGISWDATMHVNWVETDK